MWWTSNWSQIHTSKPTEDSVTASWCSCCSCICPPTAQRPTAKELLKHKFITRYTKKTAYLTELIDRYRRWKSEGHGEESSSDDSDMWVSGTCVLSKCLFRDILSNCWHQTDLTWILFFVLFVSIQTLHIIWSWIHHVMLCLIVAAPHILWILLSVSPPPCLLGMPMVMWILVPCGHSPQSDPPLWTSYRRATHTQIQR